MMQSNDRYKKVRQAQSLRQGDGTSPTGVGGGVVGAGRTPISANVPMPVASARPSAMDQVMEGAKTAKSAYDLYGDISGATAGAASAGSGMFGAGSTGGSALAGTADAYGTTQAANTGMNLGGWSGGGTTAGTVGTGSGSALGSGGSLAGGTGTTAGTTAGTTGASAGSGVASALGKGMSYAGLVMQGLNLAGNIGKEQGTYDRDKGSLGGQLSATGQGAATGSGSGPWGAVVGAALGNETYQYDHGNRKGGPLDLNAWKTSDGLKDKLAYALKGGAVGADVSGWLGLN